MDLKIGNKEYTLKFGLGFIRRLDEMYTINMDGMEFGAGLDSVIGYLQLLNPTVLVNIIKAGTDHLDSKPSNSDIEAYLESVAEAGKLEKLYKDIQDAMEVAPFLKPKLKAFKKHLKAVK